MLALELVTRRLLPEPPTYSDNAGFPSTIPVSPKRHIIAQCTVSHNAIGSLTLDTGTPLPEAPDAGYLSMNMSNITFDESRVQLLEAGEGAGEGAGAGTEAEAATEA